MSVKKFIAKSTVEALRLVKKELGADAIILSNKKIDGGVEILASTHEDLESISSNKVERIIDKKIEEKKSSEPFSIDDFCDSITNNSSDQKADENNTDNVEKTKPIIEENESKEDLYNNQIINNKVVANHDGIFKKIVSPPSITIAEVLFEKKEDLLENSQAKTLVQIQENNKKQEQKNQNSNDNKIPTEIMLELRSLRKIVERQLNKLKLNENAEVKINLLKKLLAVGFSPKISKDLILNIGGKLDIVEAESNTRKNISDLISIVKVNQDIVNKPGVYALVGPTGVGKTTTAAKIAAKAIAKYGDDSVALISTDTYRIAAHEQLKIYGKLLNIPVTLVKDSTGLKKTIDKLKENKKIIIIDSVGMSQKDKNVEKMLQGFHEVEIEKILLLPANSNADALDDIIKAYSKYGLSGCIVTKEDEAVGLGTVIDATIRNNLTIHYICNGQRVPEDIIFPNKKSLITKTFGENNLIGNKELSNLEIALLMSKYELNQED